MMDSNTRSTVELETDRPAVSVVDDFFKLEAPEQTSGAFSTGSMPVSDTSSISSFLTRPLHLQTIFGLFMVV
jgi:hypothetical protein